MRSWLRMMEHLDGKISDWAALSPLQSFLRRHHIKQGIQDAHAAILEFDVDHVSLVLHPKFNCLLVQVPNLECSYPQPTLERDETDIRDLLQVGAHLSKDENILSVALGCAR